MKVSRYMARQYANPSGWFGRLLTASLLNRANRASNRLVVETLNVMPQSRVLEVGFGGGELLIELSRKLPTASLVGVDRSQAMVSRLKSVTRQDQAIRSLSVKLGDITALPCADRQFDRVCTVNTVYFWPNLNQCALELARVTDEDGIVVLGFGSGETLTDAGYTEHGFRFHTPDDIHRAMAEAGLELQKTHRLERSGRDPFYVPWYRRRLTP